MARTVLGIGAHYDDCVFGISGCTTSGRNKAARFEEGSLVCRGPRLQGFAPAARRKRCPSRLRADGAAP